MKIISYGAALLKTKTYKGLGKILLKLSCGLLRDNGMEPKLRNMMRAANLPENYDDIPDVELPPGIEPFPNLPQDDDPHYQENWINSENGLVEYLAQIPDIPSQAYQVSIKNFTIF